MAWVPVVLIEAISIPNQGLLIPLVVPVELVLWLLAGWLTARRLARAGLGRLMPAAAVVVVGLLCVHFTNWAAFHPGSYFATHRYAFDAVAAGVRDGSVGEGEDYYGQPLPWYLRDLSTLGTAAVVGDQDGRPVVFLPQALGVPDDAAGYVYLDADPAPDLTVDLFGAPVRVVSGTRLGGGWWYLRPDDDHLPPYRMTTGQLTQKGASRASGRAPPQKRISRSAADACVCWAVITRRPAAPDTSLRPRGERRVGWFVGRLGSEWVLVR